MSSNSPSSSSFQAESVTEAWERELQELDGRLLAQGRIVKVIGAAESRELVASFHQGTPRARPQRNRRISDELTSAECALRASSPVDPQSWTRLVSTPVSTEFDGLQPPMIAQPLPLRRVLADLVTNAVTTELRCLVTSRADQVDPRSTDCAKPWFSN
jgi:hypothetical protein